MARGPEPESSPERPPGETGDSIRPSRPLTRRIVNRMARSAWKRYAKIAVKAGIAVLVLLFVGRHVQKTWLDLQKPGRSLHVEPAWIVAAGLLYLAGLSACGILFGKILKASPTPVGLWPAVRAYLISHLGKYVPGKAMVVVMRVGMVVPYGARPATAAFATFYETLVMMAAGALVAGLGFATGPQPIQVVWLLLAAGLGLAFLVVVDPLVFPRVSKLVTMPFPGVGVEALPTFTRKLLVEGLLWTLLGWLLLGASQLAVIRAISPEGIAPRLWLLVAGSVALATVAGFVVAVLPGGLGVREGVLMTTLAPALGDDTAVVAALALRLTWVVAEVLAALVLAPLRSSSPAVDVGFDASQPEGP